MHWTAATGAHNRCMPCKAVSACRAGRAYSSPRGSSLPVDSMTSRSKVPSAAFCATSCSTVAHVSRAAVSCRLLQSLCSMQQMLHSW